MASLTESSIFHKHFSFLAIPQHYLTTSSLPKCCEHKIQNLATVVGWFKSKSEQPLLAPPEGLNPNKNDVYVHQSGQSIQTWIMVNGQWKSGIRDGFHHPTLPDYQLYMREGNEPTWVTRKTQITYQGCAKSRKVSAHTCLLNWLTQTVKDLSFPPAWRLSKIISLYIAHSPKS